MVTDSLSIEIAESLLFICMSFWGFDFRNIALAVIFNNDWKLRISISEIVLPELGDLDRVISTF